MDEKQIKLKVLKILNQAAGERAAGNFDAANNHEEQATALQKQYNLPAENDAASQRRKVEAYWSSLPPATLAVVRLSEPGMTRKVDRVMTMEKALPLLKSGEALFCKLAIDENYCFRRDQMTTANTKPLSDKKEDGVIWWW